MHPGYLYFYYYHTSLSSHYFSLVLSSLVFLSPHTSFPLSVARSLALSGVNLIKYHIMQVFFPLLTILGAIIFTLTNETQAVSLYSSPLRSVVQSDTPGDTYRLHDSTLSVRRSLLKPRTPGKKRTINPNELKSIKNKKTSKKPSKKPLRHGGVARKHHNKKVLYTSKPNTNDCTAFKEYNKMKQREDQDKENGQVLINENKRYICTTHETCMDVHLNNLKTLGLTHKRCSIVDNIENIPQRKITFTHVSNNRPLAFILPYDYDVLTLHFFLLIHNHCNIHLDSKSWWVQCT